MWNVPHRLMNVNTQSPAVPKHWLGNVMEPLQVGDLMEEVGHWEQAFRVHSPAPLSVYFLLPDCEYNVTSCFMPLLPHLPFVMDISFKPGAKINPSSLKLFLRYLAAREAINSHGYDFDIISTNLRSKPSKGLLQWCCEVTSLGVVAEPIINLSFFEATSHSSFLPCHPGRRNNMWSGHN